MKLFLMVTFILSSISFSQDFPDFLMTLTDNWQIQSSEKINISGNQISSPDYVPVNWYKTKLPSTVLAALVRNDIYKDIFYGENLKLIPGEQFAKAWWYRNEFVVPEREGLSRVKLLFEGINYRANIWINGKQVADSDIVFGAFRQFEFDITDYIIKDSRNILAVEVFPPVPGDYTIGFVDWSPTPPDKNMGIWREVKIKLCGDVSIDFPFVKTEFDVENYKNAKLTISAELKNNTSQKVNLFLNGEIELIKFSKPVELDPYQAKLITFSPSDFPELTIADPRVWWPNDLGNQELYELKVSAVINNKISDECKTRFAIREVKDYFTEQGYRGYVINGKKILIRGGGWVDNMLLDNSYDNIEAQVKYARHMNLNTLRLEGFWGSNEDLYNLCDQYGILLMVGWSCQWEWEAYIGKKDDEYGAIANDADKKLLAQSWKDQVKWLRNHPSIFIWFSGSDKIPHPEIEKQYIDILAKDDPLRPYLSSAANRTSTISGSTGVKMMGPYDYVPPHYWYSDSLNGGAYGFNTETGPGPQIPVLESLKKFIPGDHLWPIDSVWDFHCGGGEFKNLNRYNEAMNSRLGKPENIEDYVMKAQYLNYEGMRAMFEAFIANKYKATGIIQWMYNSAWPKLWWQLYDYYLIPTAAFYGLRKACEPLHMLYNYGDSTIVITNNLLTKQDSLKAEVRILNFDLTEKFSKSEIISLKEDESIVFISLKNLKDFTPVYFADLRLYKSNGELLSSNFYCLSAKKEILDYENNTWFVTPVKQYADFTQLNTLPTVELNLKYDFLFDREKGSVSCRIENPSAHIALQVELSLIKENGESVAPVFWDDNYLSLLPGEKRLITGSFDYKDTGNKNPGVKVTGWNVKQNIRYLSK